MTPQAYITKLAQEQSSWKTIPAVTAGATLGIVPGMVAGHQAAKVYGGLYHRLTGKIVNKDLPGVKIDHFGLWRSKEFKKLLRTDPVKAERLISATNAGWRGVLPGALGGSILGAYLANKLVQN